MTAEKPVFCIQLQPNPEAFNKYVDKLGVKGVVCHELPGFESELLTRKANAFLEDIYGQLAASGNGEVPQWAFFTQQKVRNVCGTYALFHALVNNLKHIDIEGSQFGDWLGLSKQNGVDQCADLLVNNSKLTVLHEHCAQNESETNVPDKVDYHFITYIVHEGHLFEFDSMQEFPRDCGPSSDATFLADVGTVCKELVAQLETISCNAIVLSAKQD
uniref:Ubiquitin carboxyl-terminal hydrolase n=1 Tax=Globodera pallida TaxID=36090 RepID=A0A183CJ05_GLOPA